MTTPAGRTAPRITVVIVNYNGEELLHPCLAALEDSALPREDFAVWVVDNASADRSCEVVSNKHPSVRLIRNSRNRGFAGGNDVALHQVTTPYVALLNSDTMVDPQWLPALVTALDEADPHVAAITSKIVFLPRFASLALRTEGFTPGPQDPRDLGVRIGRIELLGADGTAIDVTERTLWEQASYGPENVGGQRFRWTRPAGELLIPVAGVAGGRPDSDPALPPDVLDAPVTVRLTVAAERPKALRLILGDSPGGQTEASVETEVEVGPDYTTVDLGLAAGAALHDVVNNTGALLLPDGYGADRGFQQVDTGQYDEGCEVFGGCGAAVAFRTEVGHRLGWFDEDFFLYYEDTDLSWRLRTDGWTIRYEPRAVVRHVHSATSEEWSPLFVFHVDRNRLLMLTKNATTALALREVLRYPVTTASMLARALLAWSSERRRPDKAFFVLRARVIASYLRLLPAMLRKRRELAGGAVVSPAAVQARWMAPR